MKLTGKAKEAFLDFYWKNKLKPLKMTICKKEDLETFFDTISELFQNALIIEFFDSVGIYISIHYETFGSHYFNAMVTRNHLTTNLRTDSISRTEATNAAIERANTIYNET